MSEEWTQALVCILENASPARLTVSPCDRALLFVVAVVLNFTFLSLFEEIPGRKFKQKIAHGDELLRSLLVAPKTQGENRGRCLVYLFEDK